MIDTRFASVSFAASRRNDGVGMVKNHHKSQKLTYRVTLPGDQARLRELILYVAKRSSSMTRFGLIKLNKIIWRADFTAFLERQVPVTGRAYQRLRLGPAPVEMPPILGEMQQDGDLQFNFLVLGQDSEGRDIVEKRPIALREPDLRWFSADDMQFVDRAIEHYRPMTGMEASDDSHGPAWSTREDSDPMPYEAALFSIRALGAEQLDRIKSLAIERGWKSL